MKKISALLIALMMVWGFSLSAQAALWDRGGGLIYDDVLDITWLQDANYADTTGYDDALYGHNTDGRMDWAEAMTWADTLSYYDSVRGYTYTDWRLPNILPVNGVSYDYNFSYDGSTDYGFNMTAPASAYLGSTGSEMAYMYYQDLGNRAYYDTYGSGPQLGWGLSNTGLFTNLQPYVYWSGTEYAPDPGLAWVFDTSNGKQLTVYKDKGEYFTVWNAWAVRPGDVVIPEPGTMLLLGAGLAGLAAWRKRR